MPDNQELKPDESEAFDEALKYAGDYCYKHSITRMSEVQKACAVLVWESARRYYTRVPDKELIEAAEITKAWLQLFIHANDIFQTQDAELNDVFKKLEAAIAKSKSVNV